MMRLFVFIFIALLGGSWALAEPQLPGKAFIANDALANQTLPTEDISTESAAIGPTLDRRYDPAYLQEDELTSCCSVWSESSQPDYRPDLGETVATTNEPALPQSVETTAIETTDSSADIVVLPEPTATEGLLESPSAISDSSNSSISGDEQALLAGDVLDSKDALEVTIVDNANAIHADTPYNEVGIDYDLGELFPSTDLINRQKDFWVKVFAEYNTQQGLLHYRNLTMPIFKALDLTGMSRNESRSYINKQKRVVHSQLLSIADALENNSALSAELQELRNRLPVAVTPDEVREMSKHIRFQRGLSNRFQQGLHTSGSFRNKILAALRHYGVPEDIFFLPHVESSFNLKSSSKYGAAGVWQFTYYTGKLFMTVNDSVDERLDPIIAAYAAAKFLKQSYDRFQSWPLAITSYNHGPAGIARIMKSLKTDHLEDMIIECGCRMFSFASKNFYAEFLAAREVALHPERYFQNIKYNDEWTYNEVELPAYVSINALAEGLGLPASTLADYNPALLSIVTEGEKYIPKNYTLKIPVDITPEDALVAVSDDDWHDSQKDVFHVRVQRGDTLYSIGRRYGLSWQKIALANNIRNSHRIRPGDKLIIPQKNMPVPIASTADADAKPAVEPVKAPVTNTPVVTKPPVQYTASIPAPSIKTSDISLNPDLLKVFDYDEDSNSGYIVTAFGETIGHYAEWASTSARSIRSANYISSNIKNGVQLRINFDQTSQLEFNNNRIRFHAQRINQFLQSNQIEGAMLVELQPGETIWELCQRFGIPVWLFLQQNPGLNSAGIKAGQSVMIPLIKAL